jgi:seipin
MGFWACELAFMSVAWAIFGSLLGSSPSSNKLDYKSRKGQRRLTTEEPDPQDSDENDENDGGSDHPHQFPTYGKQPALKHEPDIKDEEEHKQPLHEIPVAGEEADDEEDAESPRDSGIGTSYSGEGSSSVRKRKSQSRLE